MAAHEIRVPKTIKPCVIAMAQGGDGRLAAMAVTWIMQSGHEPPRFEVSIDQRHNTHRAAVELGWLVLSFATPALREAFDALGSTSANDPDVDKLQILREQNVVVNYTEDGTPWLPEARANLLCRVGQLATTEDGYTIFSCEPIAELGGTDADQLYYAGRVAGARSYITAGTPALAITQ